MPKLTFKIDETNKCFRSIDTRMSNIENSLTAVDKHLNGIKRGSVIADSKWNISLGLTAMVIAYTWLTDSLPANDFSGKIIGALGILLLLWIGYAPLFSSLWRKWRSKGQQ